MTSTSVPLWSVLTDQIGDPSWCQEVQSLECRDGARDVRKSLAAAAASAGNHLAKAAHRHDQDRFWMLFVLVAADAADAAAERANRPHRTVEFCEQPQASAVAHRLTAS